MSEYASPPPVRICLLGAPSITTPRGAISPAKPLVFAAALYLGLKRGRAVRRDELAVLLWPDASDAKHSERMRWLVRQLRLSGLVLAPGAPEIALARADVQLDIDALVAAPSAAHVLALAQADVLAGYDPQISDRFSRWLDETRGAYRADVLHTLGEWLATTQRSRSWQSVEAIARRMLAVDDERADAAAALSAAASRHGVPFDGDSIEEREAETFVGREEVLARLAEGLEPSAASGHRLGIAGPSGIGKSRLLAELARRAEGRKIRVARLRCQRGDELRPLSLAIDLTRALMQMPGALGVSPQSMTVLRRFIGEESSPDDGEPSETRRAAVYGAVRDLVAAVTDEAGLLVMVDDAQWAEPSSWTLLAPAFSQRSATPLCWTATIRAETEDDASRAFETIFPWDDAVSEQERELLWLAPLAAADIAQLCRARARSRDIPAAVLEVLAVRAAGIPFIAEALVDHWLEIGDASSLPPSVTRLVRSRLERMPRNAGELLRAVAVLGLDATPPAIEAVAQLGRRELAGAVAALETSGILRTERGVFSAHALWTEAALSRAPKAMLQLFHRYAAEWLEQQILVDERAEPRHYWSVATHWIDAEDHGKARHALDHAANVLAANGFIMEAAAMLERAGDLAGESSVALQYMHRAAMLLLQELTLHAIETVTRLKARYDVVARTVEGDDFTPHHEVELFSKIALGRNRNHSDRNGSLHRWLPCATARDASPYHRLTATAVVLYHYGRCDLDAATATALWHAAAEIVPTNEPEALEYERCAAEYYARIARESELAAVHMDRAVAIVMTSDECDAGDYTRKLLGVADCFEKLGDIQASLTIRYERVTYGERHNNRHITLMALEGLIGVLLELGRAREARPLLAAFGYPASGSLTHDTVECARKQYWVLCALEEGNVALAREELRVGLEEAEAAGGVWGTRLLATFAHLALLEGDDVLLRRLLPQLLAHFTNGCRFVDHPALMTALILERFEGWEAAAAFVRRFVTVHRDERWTPRAELCRFLEDGAGRINVTHGAQHEVGMRASA